MRVDVVMPQMGESIAEGTITRWIKKAGDRVEQDEPIFEISTDKVDAEIPSKRVRLPHRPHPKPAPRLRLPPRKPRRPRPFQRHQRRAEAESRSSHRWSGGSRTSTASTPTRFLEAVRAAA